MAVHTQQKQEELYKLISIFDKKKVSPKYKQQNLLNNFPKSLASVCCTVNVFGSE